MHLSETIGLADLRQLDEKKRFEAIFAYYVSLKIPYETVSNFETKALVRAPAEIAATVAAQRGGHCIEHASLLAALLEEQGIRAKVISGDHTNVECGVYSALASTFAMATVVGESYLCDPFYGAVRARVPKSGGCLRDGVVIRRLDPNTIVYVTFEGETMYRDDVVYENVDFSERLALIESRYRDFFPFGVLTPYYQEVRPKWRSLLYSPKFDCYVVQEKRTSFQIPIDKLDTCEWIPKPIRTRIPLATEFNRAQREIAIRFLRRGLFNPFYLSVAEMPAIRIPEGRNLIEARRPPAHSGGGNASSARA
jgi:hypothetical protein